jgi:hypothetical protein
VSFRGFNPGYNPHAARDAEIISHVDEAQRQRRAAFTADPTANYHRGNLHSRAAHESILHHKERILAAVVRTIHDAGRQGLTCDEIEMRLDLSHQTASARCTEAKARNLIVHSGRTRATRSGRSAAVYIAKEFHDPEPALPGL